MHKLEIMVELRTYELFHLLSFGLQAIYDELSDEARNRCSIADTHEVCRSLFLDWLTENDRDVLVADIRRLLAAGKDFYQAVQADREAFKRIECSGELGNYILVDKLVRRALRCSKK